MSKILISWFAKNHDFTWLYRGTVKEQKDKVNEDGPAFNVHRYFGNEYKTHVLLNSSNEPKEIQFFNLLVSELKEGIQTFDRGKIDAIKDPINIAEIFSKVSDFLLEYKDSEIEIFVNPGTPQMQIAWYLVKTQFQKNVSLFQIKIQNFQKPESQNESIRILTHFSIQLY